MDRVEFVQSIPDSNDHETLKELILNYFNEVMLLYNLVGTCEDTSITKTDSDCCVASFSVVFKTESEACKMHNIMNQFIITCYNKKYIIHTKYSKKTVDINMDYF